MSLLSGTIVSDYTTDVSYDVAGLPGNRIVRPSVATDSVLDGTIGLGLGLSQSSTINTIKQVEMERHNEAEFGAQQRGLLREQISSISREVGSMLQDINTLRLADSQHEVQGAEMSRHLREMQAQLRAEILAEVRAREELEARIHIKINVVADDAARVTQGSTQDFQDRTVKLSEAIEADRRDRAGDRRELLAALDEVRSLGAELDSQTRERTSFESSIQRSSEDLRDAISKVAVDTRRSLEEQQRGVMGCIEALEERIQRELGSHKQETIISVTNLKEKLSNVGQEVNDVSHQLKEHASRTSSDAEARHNTLSRAMEELERKMKDGGLTSKSIEAVEKRMREELNNHTSEHRGRYNELKILIDKTINDSHNRHTELKDQLHSSTAQERASRDEMVRSIMGKVEALAGQWRKDLGDHKSSLTTEFRDAIGQERQNREKLHNTVLNRLEDMDRKVKDAVTNFSRDDGSHISLSDLSALDRKLRDELASLANDHHHRHLELKDQLGKFSSDHNGRYSEVQEMLHKGIGQHKAAQDDLLSHFAGTLQELEGRLRREIADHKQGIDKHHSSIREFVAKERQDRESNHGSILGRLEDVDRKVKDAISQLSGSQESHHLSLGGQLGALERKMRDEMVAQHNEHQNRHGDLRELILSVQAERMQSGEFPSSDTGFLEELLRKHDGVRTAVAYERQLRERSHSAIVDRLVGIERKVLGDISHVAMEAQLAKQSAIVAQSTHHEIKDVIAGTIAKERAHTQALLAKEQGERIVNQEQLNQRIAQERSQREGQQESLRHFVNSEKMSSASRQQDIIVTREEFERVLRRVWDALDSHTHDYSNDLSASRRFVSVQQLDQGVGAQPVATQRIVVQPPTTVPMPPSPVGVTAGTHTVQSTVYKQPVVLPPQAQRVEGSQSPALYTRSLSPLPGVASATQATPMAVASLDLNRDGRPDVLVMGVDRNNDGIPDFLQQASPVVGGTQIIGRSTSPLAGQQQTVVMPAQAVQPMVVTTTIPVEIDNIKHGAQAASWSPAANTRIVGRP